MITLESSSTTVTTGLTEAQVLALILANLPAPTDPGLLPPILSTYAALAALVASYSLVLGQEYIIADFATTYILPTTATAYVGATEAIIVKASGSNAFYKEASSAAYPKDILFYSFNNATATTTTKGFIYRRIDTQENVSVPFDFRNVKFRRYKSDLTAYGLTNDYFLWNTSATISYNIATNTSITLTGNPADYVDYFAFPQTTGNLRNVLIDNYYAEGTDANWSPANYNFVFRSTNVQNVKLGNFSFNFTIITTGGCTDISGGNITNTIWLSSSFILAQNITSGCYVGISSAIIYYTDGNSAQDIYYSKVAGFYLKGNRINDSQFKFLNNSFINVYRARSSRYAYMANFGIGTQVETISGIDIESSGGSSSINGYSGLNITVFTGAVSGQDGSTYLMSAKGNSNVPFSYLISGLTTIDFGATSRLLLGRAIITSINSTENVNAFSNIPNAQTWFVLPAAGLILTLTNSGTLLLGSPLAAITLNGANGDYAQFINIGGVAKLLTYKTF